MRRLERLRGYAITSADSGIGRSALRPNHNLRVIGVVGVRHLARSGCSSNSRVFSAPLSLAFVSRTVKWVVIDRLRCGE